MNDEIKSLIFEACNEWGSMGLPRTHEIHECFMRSTGDRDKHPAPLCALAKWALTDDVRPTPSEEARLVSYHPDGDTCTLNINGVEMYYDRVDRDTQPAPSVPEVAEGIKAAMFAAQAQPAPSIPEISDDLIEVIESRAEQSYRRHHGGIRGQQVTPADALSWHIIHATRDVLATAAQEAKP